MQFARWLKENLEDSGFSVFFDEEGIAKDVDSQSATGNAIKACDGLVAIINPVFVESPFCNNEVAMAQGNGLQLFPILFRGMRVELLPTGLRQLLGSTTCIPFAHPKTDAQSKGLR